MLQIFKEKINGWEEEGNGQGRVSDRLILVQLEIESSFVDFKLTNVILGIND